MKRRSFIKKMSAGSLGMGVAIGTYAWQVEPFWLEFVQMEMPIKGLPTQLDGKTLMQISDIHVGDRFDPQFIVDSFVEAQELDPDFVVYTGDYVSYQDGRQLDQLKEVMKYTVHGRLGTAAILGNHDYGHNWSEPDVANNIAEMLDGYDIDVLRNEQQEYQGLNIVGLDDMWGTNYDPSTTLSQVDANAANLVLCHNPEICDTDVWHGYKGWVLSGHTHGGQVKPPFLPPLVLPVKNKKYSSGVIDVGHGRQLYINRALGHLWQVRFNVRPEITLFTLRSV